MGGNARKESFTMYCKYVKHIGRFYFLTHFLSQIKTISAEHSSNIDKTYQKHLMAWYYLNAVQKKLSRLTLKLTPREKIELEGVHISPKQTFPLSILSKFGINSLLIA